MNRLNGDEGYLWLTEPKPPSHPVSALLFPASPHDIASVIGRVGAAAAFAGEIDIVYFDDNVWPRRGFEELVERCRAGGIGRLVVRDGLDFKAFRNDLPTLDLTLAPFGVAVECINRGTVVYHGRPRRRGAGGFDRPPASLAP